MNTSLAIKDLTVADLLSREAMAAVHGGDGKTKEPVGKPTHIDIMNNTFTFKDGSQWSMDLGGNFHPK